MKRVALVLACIVLVMASVGTVAASADYAVRLPVVVSSRSVAPAMDLSIPYGAPVVSFWPEAGVPALLGYATPMGCSLSSIAALGSPLRNPDGFFVDPASDYSAWNPEAAHPPYLCTQINEPYWPAMCLPGGDGGWAPTTYITKNSHFEQRIDPDALLAYLEAQRDCR